jgi:stalled ribosome rescue protein Dom34
VNTTENNADIPDELKIQESIAEQAENAAEIVQKDPLQEKIQGTNEVLAQRVEQRKLRKEKMVEDFVSLEKVDTKIAEVMTQVTFLEQTQGAVSDAAVDSLLRMAQKELMGEQVLGESQAVDALALLSDVENELNRSLRDQLFEKLKDGYVKVRSAIAYRNE